jgi:hypothetical protein
MLDSTANALAMAENLFTSFLSETQAAVEYGAPDVHDLPKTMAIVNVTAFNAFHKAWEALSSQMLTILASDRDPNFYAALSRARDATLSFSGYLGDNTAIDIGSFLDQLYSICDPDISSLAPLINLTRATYVEQFLLRGVGTGTAAATGMHVTWPGKGEYRADPEFFDTELFSAYYDDDAPEWMSFLLTFLNATTPTEAGENSACLASMESALEPAFAGQLLLNPTMESTDTGSFVFSEIPLTADLVIVQYGLVLNHWLSQRRLREKLANAKSSRTSTDPSASKGHTRHGKRHLSQSQRKVQAGSYVDFYYLYAGDVPVQYVGPVAAAAFDYFFYYMVFPGGYENVYVTDYGGGQQSFPVCYFSPDNERSPSDLAGIVVVENAEVNLGCIRGEVFFSLGENFTHFTLYANNDGTFIEVPLDAGGQISPILNVELQVGGEIVWNFVGGLNETIVDWGYDNGLDLLIITDPSLNLDLYGSETSGVVSMQAFDFDLIATGEGGVDVAYFPYSLAGNSSISKAGEGRSRELKTDVE